MQRGLQNHQDYSDENLSNLTSIYERLMGEKPSTYPQYKDRGFFFVGSRYKRSDSAARSKKFAEPLLKDEPFWVEAIAGGNRKPAVMVVVRGIAGLEQAVEKLQASGHASVDAAGPIAMFKDIDPRDDANRWSPS